MTKKETKEICLEYSTWKNDQTEYRGNCMYTILYTKLQLEMKDFIAKEEELYDYFIKNVYKK